MQLNDVAHLVKLLDKSSLTEISFSDENSKVVLKKELYRATSVPAGMVSVPVPMAVPQGSAGASPASTASQAPSASEKPNSKLKEVTSPMVGTYYASSTPGSPPLVQVGSAVRPGQVLCIIEAMKIMNEIESDVGGVVDEVCVANEMPVEYGTVLFRIRPG